ncbi:MAG: HIT family protein [Candidatus Woesearchaeota archaeon]
MADETIFTKIVKGEIPASKVYEDEEFLAFLDISPVNKGHVLVITKEIFPTLKDMPVDMVSRMFKVVHKLTGPVMEASDAPMFNWYVIGDEVPHAHVHIVPRYEGDGKLSLSHGKYQNEEIEQYAEKIRNKIDS